MTAEHPFMAKTMKEDRDRLIFSVALNEEEQADLAIIKQFFGIDENSKALKAAAKLGKNVLQSYFAGIKLHTFFKKP